MIKLGSRVLKSQLAAGRIHNPRWRRPPHCWKDRDPLPRLPHWTQAKPAWALALPLPSSSLLLTASSIPPLLPLLGWATSSPHSPFHDPSWIGSLSPLLPYRPMAFLSPRLSHFPSPTIIPRRCRRIKLLLAPTVDSGLESKSSSAIDWLCDLGQVASPLWASYKTGLLKANSWWREREPSSTKVFPITSGKLWVLSKYWLIFLCPFSIMTVLNFSDKLVISRCQNFISILPQSQVTVPFC